MTEKERAEQLVTAHWEYVEDVLKTHGVTGIELVRAQFHYISAFKHAYFHAIEDERNRMFQTLPLGGEGSTAAPLPGSARYEEIHAELTEGEVAEIAQPRCIYGGVTECKRDCPACKFGGDSGMM